MYERPNGKGIQFDSVASRLTCLWYILLVITSLVVSTNAINCLERLCVEWDVETLLTCSPSTVNSVTRNSCFAYD